MRTAINKAAIAIASAWLLSSSAHAWMEYWAPKFDCTPAEVEELPAANVSNYVSTVHFEGDWYPGDYYWKRCKGYSLDLNGDGIKDSVYCLPYDGCGVASRGYETHCRVSAGADKWVDTYILGMGDGTSKDNLVKVAGKVYFRHSEMFGDFENSKHNHWVYQVFSFNKQGEFICSNGDFGGLFPAVTIFYINPKFRQIKLTSRDLEKIARVTKGISEQHGPYATAEGVGFDLLKYRYLCNDDAEKAQMAINPASKKKEANGWKPPRKLSEKEANKLIQIITKRFGPPARCKKRDGAFVYVWRFEGAEWLSIEVSTSEGSGGDVTAIKNWAWRKPELSVYEEEELEERISKGSDPMDEVGEVE